jgi:OPA family glycerol-3-phosphate transporter-like MFS transporter
MKESKKTASMAKSQKSIVLMCCIVYFISYITRKNYAAIMVEFVNDTGIAIDSASLALTGHAIFYGAGQLVSGYLGDKIKPKFLIACGLFTTALMNILLPFCSEVALLTTVWCINGLAQAMMWPPIVKALSSTFSSSDDYKKSTVKVSNSAMIATVLLYLLSPVCITYAGWETIFYVAGALAAVMAFVVLFFMPDTADQKETAPEKTNDKEETHMGAGVKFPFVLFGLIMIAIILQGMMRDGVSDWLPTYLENEFAISSQVAILLGVAPPIFAMLCFELVSFLSRKVVKNELFFAGIIFAISFVSSCALSFFSSSSIALSTILSTIVTGSMHGVNLILICLLPPYFKKTGRVSLISGLLNSCTYVGSALSGYGFAVLAKLFGWRGTIIGWAIICGVATVICLALVKKWQSFKNQA